MSRLSEARELLSTRHRSEPGQALVIFALFLFVLVGFLALSIDAGYIMAERRQAQSAADAGALAAAKALLDKKTGEIQATGTQYAQQNTTNSASVTVSYPPASGNYQGNALYVQVSVTRPVTQFFVGAIYTGAWQVSATATAGVELQPADYALITLKKDAKPGIYQNGNTGIVITNGPGQSGEASAMSNGDIRGANNTTFTTPGYIDANGDIQESGVTNPSGRIREGQAYIEDPLKDMTPPTISTPRRCTGVVWQPGRYTNQNCQVTGAVILNPGVYYFQNTDVSLKNSALMTGSGVILYFDSASSFDPKNGGIDISTRSGGWGGVSGAGGIRDGLVFWYAPCDNLDLQGNAIVRFTGIFYAPCADVTMHGNPSNDTVNGQIFVGTLDVRGTSDLRLTYREWVDITRPRVFLVE